MGSIVVREAITDADLEAWARVKRAVLPNESAWTPEQFRSRAEPTRRVTLAELDGQVVGCGLGGRSDVAGRSFLTPRVHPDFRRRGVGTALLRDLIDFARGLEFPLLVALPTPSEARTSPSALASSKPTARWSRCSPCPT